MRNDRAMHGGRFLIYATAGALLAAASLWATIARGEARTGRVEMASDDAAVCARFRAAGAPVAGIAPCTIGLGRVREKCEGDPDCVSPASARTWVYRPAKWLEARWKATPTASPRPTPSPRTMSTWAMAARPRSIRSRSIRSSTACWPSS